MIDLIIQVKGLSYQRFAPDWRNRVNAVMHSHGIDVYDFVDTLWLQRNSVF